LRNILHPCITGRVSGSRKKELDFIGEKIRHKGHPKPVMILRIEIGDNIPH